MDKIFEKITEAVTNKEESDQLMTAALQAAEDGDYPESMKLLLKVLAKSDNIEQRLAAMALRYALISSNPYAVENLLIIAYKG